MERWRPVTGISRRLRLSALDVSPIPSGASPGQALGFTIDLARYVEKLGFARFWLAEHHNAKGLASSAPEVMIGQVAAATTTIRVGAGGIMLPNHAPLKVAEVFRVLSALFPGRIDLGLGRAAGTDPRTALALRRSHGAMVDDFPAQLTELLGYLDDGDASPREAFSRSIVAIPAGVPRPELFMLGSSEYGGALAARMGLPYAFARQINPDDAVPVLARYRDEFRPSRYASEPYSILSVAVICAETDAQAEELAASADLGSVHFAQGLRDYPIPSVEEARTHQYSEDERALVATYRDRYIVGGVARVRARLLELASAAAVDEVVIMTNVHDQDARRRSYALIAEALG